LNTAFLLVSMLAFLNNGGGTGGSIYGDEIAGIGLGAAALVGAVGYLLMRRRNKQ